MLNAGLGGNRVLKAGLGPSMRDRFARDVLSVPEATHVIIMGGANDIGLPGLLGGTPPTGAELTDGLLELAVRAKEHGIQPILGHHNAVPGGRPGHPRSRQWRAQVAARLAGRRLRRARSPTRPTAPGCAPRSTPVTACTRATPAPGRWPTRLT